MNNFSRDDLINIVDEGVRKGLQSAGLDTDNLQHSQADFVFLRRTRKRCEMAASKFVSVSITAMVTGIIAATWYWLKEHI